MSIDIFKRDPRGRFIWEGGALCAWLPELLERRRFPERAIETALECTAIFCERRASRELESAAIECRREPQERMFRPIEYITPATVWLQRAAIIRKAKEEIKGVPF